MINFDSQLTVSRSKLSKEEEARRNKAKFLVDKNKNTIGKVQRTKDLDPLSSQNIKGTRGAISAFGSLFDGSITVRPIKILDNYCAANKDTTANFYCTKLVH